MGGLTVQIGLLALLVVVLLVVAVLVANVNTVVRFQSGIDDNDTLRRLWSDPRKSLFIASPFPILVSWVLAYGINALTRGAILALLQVVDAVTSGDDIPLTARLAVAFSATSAGTLVAVLYYVTYGGQKLQAQAAGSTLLSWVAGLLPIALSAPVGVVVAWAAALAVLVAVITWWVSKNAGNRTSMHTVRELMETHKIAPPQTGNEAALVAFCAALLVVLTVVRKLILKLLYDKGYADMYLGHVLRNISTMMVLIGCSFVSIRLVSRRIGRRSMEWQWPSFGLPVLAVLVSLVWSVFFHPGFPGAKRFVEHDVVHYLDAIAMPLTAGFLGVFVYLAVLVRAAQNALDPGIEGQSELILDDDEDSEFEP